MNTAMTTAMITVTAIETAIEMIIEKGAITGATTGSARKGIMAGGTMIAMTRDMRSEPLDTMTARRETHGI